MQIVVFTLDNSYYAFKTEQVDEISKTCPVSRMPQSGEWIEGLVNLRGEIIALVNLEKILDRKITGDYNNFIIINYGDSKAGILVKDVKEVAEIEPENIEKLSEQERGQVAGIIQIEDRIVNYLDIQELMDKRG